jgi:Uma2 family endonuclease
MAMPLSEYFTAEQVRNFPDDGNRYETVHGELLVTPAPGGRHQWVVKRLLLVLERYLEANGRDDLLQSPADISWDDATLVQPDLFVGDLGRFRETWDWADIRTLWLVIEVLSPSTEHADRVVKRRLYQERRIPQYWVVDPERREIAVWTPAVESPRLERERVVWRHPLVAATCMVELARIFP